MAKILANFNDELDEEFRHMVFEMKGLKKGVIQECLEEAVTEWIENRKKSLKK